MNSTQTTLEISGLGLMLLGGLMVTGLFQPFSGSTSSTCVGILVGPFCLGYWQNTTTVNGNNLIIGIASVFGGLVLFFLGVTHRE